SRGQVKQHEVKPCSLGRVIVLWRNPFQLEIGDLSQALGYVWRGGDQQDRYIGERWQHGICLVVYGQSILDEQPGAVGGGQRQMRKGEREGITLGEGMGQQHFLRLRFLDTYTPSGHTVRALAPHRGIDLVRE